MENIRYYQREDPYDIGRGRILPTTSVDAYMAELAGWFGVPQSEITTVIPNIIILILLMFYLL